MPADPALLDIFPRSAGVRDGHLWLGGCDAVELAEEFGTPLYVFDEAEVRLACREARRAFTSRHPASDVAYAAKAYIGVWLAALLADEGMAMDVVSAGELAVALSAGFPAERVHFHGNNKGRGELMEALEAGIGRVVVDNFHELNVLDDVAARAGRRQRVMLRLSPGVDPHTHAKTTTGILDSKFGFPIQTGQAEDAVRRALAAPWLQLTGLHCHLGSPIFDVEPYREATDIVVGFAAEMAKRHGLRLEEYSPGGGFAVQYTRDQPAPGFDEYAEAIVLSLRDACEKHGLPLPRLIVEPGRSIVGRAGVALYTVGSTKEIPGVRRYVSVDGGMADNTRPAMYGARYEALVANKADAPAVAAVTIAGKYCESGDVLVRDVRLPDLAAGDVVAIPAAGAYCLAMASNYNMALKPAVVAVHDGRARVVRRRETYADLVRCDVGAGEV